MNTPKDKVFDIQWLLEFANLPFKKGIPSVFRPIVKPLKRTPTKEPEPLKDLSEETIKSLKAYYEKEGYTKDAINKCINEHKKNRGIIDNKGYSWTIENGKPVFAGHGKCYPTAGEFNVFLEKYGFSPTGKEFGLWNKTFHIFSYLARINLKIELGEYEESEYLISEFCREYEKDSRVKFGGSLENIVCVCIYNFWEKSGDLHPYLRQCMCCGMFWIAENKKGRGKARNVFCGEICEKKFGESSREDNKKRVRELRSENKESQQSEDIAKLEKWLVDKEGYSPKKAKERAYEIIYRYGETFKNYKRKASQKYGIF